MSARPKQTGWAPKSRLSGLRRFAFGITMFNVLGHTVLGFEQSLAAPCVALLSTYFTELFLEWVGAKADGRAPAYRGQGFGGLVDFLLSAHISGVAIGMLLYANDRLWPLVFAGVTAIASKALLRVSVGERDVHVFNPSNLGITMTLILFPWVGIAPPYHFTENVSGIWNWVLIGGICVIGTFLNGKVTKRLPLIAGWLSMFVAQAAVRAWLFDASFLAGVVPMSGVAFLLFTFYMVSDPATTPRDRRGQFGFGASVALVYGVLMAMHVVFGLFFALSLVCAARFLGLWVLAIVGRRATDEAKVLSLEARS